MEQSITLTNDVPGIGKAGERVTLELKPSDVHDPTELPTYLAGYKPFGYRADEVSPPVLVDNDEDKYRTFSSDDAFRAVNVKSAGTAAIPEVDPQSSLTAYKVIDRFIGSFIPKQTESQTGNNYQPRMAAGRRCRRAIDLDREIDVMTLIGTSTNFAAGQRTAAGTAWDGAGDPIKDLQTAIEKSAQPVSSIWFNQKVAHAFLRNDNVKDHMRQMLGDQAMSGGLTQLGMANGVSVDFVIPGLPPFHVVASKVKNETTSALDYNLGDVAALLTVPPGIPEDGEEIATTYTFRRRGPSGTGYEAREFEIEDRGPLGGTMVVVSVADVAVITANNAGGIVTGVHS